MCTMTSYLKRYQQEVDLPAHWLGCILTKHFKEHGFDAAFPHFGESDGESALAYHYRDPTTCREMLDIIAEEERDGT